VNSSQIPAESDKNDSFNTIKDFIDDMEKIEIQREKQNQS